MEIKISAQYLLDVTNGMNKQKPFGYVGEQNFIILFSEVKPIDGYEIPVNEKTGKKLPFCCNFHSTLFYGITKWYNKKFPNCCTNHKMLAANPQFKKTDYKSVAEKVVSQLSYTEHVIRTNIDNADWYKDITDYIEYNTFSFGHPVSVGNNYYLNNVLAMLEDMKFFEGIDDSKKIALINFVKSYFEPIEKVEGTDLNLLHSIYQDWLNTFPFDLSFFENLKPYFEKQFPILKGKVESNKYLGTVRLKLHTRESLIIYLLSVTDSIIKQINTYSLYQKGLLKEPEKIKLEIILSERKLELKNGYLQNIENDSKQFENILNKWFKHEKRFIDDIIPLLKAIPSQNIESKRFAELQEASKNIVENVKLILESYEDTFNQNIKSYKYFFEKNGIIVPNDTNDFFRWIAIAYPDENLQFIIEAVKNPNNFKNYHEYKERLFNNPDWNDEKEEDFLKNVKKDTKEEDSKIKYTAKHYALTYILDCKAIGESLPHGNKKELEKIGNKRIGIGRGNTFYKNYNEITNKDFSIEENLIEIAGEDWRKIILKLSNDPEKLEQYLRSIQM